MNTPRNEKEFKDLFGTFTFKPVGSGAILITDRKWALNIVQVNFGPRKVWMHKVLKDILEKAWQDWLNSNSTYIVSRVEGFVPRHQYWNQKYPLSIHSWGAALDINPSSNMPGKKGDIDPGLVQILKSAGFRWGGDYKKRDDMHFEFYKGLSF